MMNRRGVTRTLSILLAGASSQVFWVAEASAQAPEAEPVTTIAANDGGDQGQTTTASAEAQGEQDVVVTAQRREQQLQDVPIAITAITGEAAERQGVRTVDDIQIATPALSITRVNQTPLFYLRGVGTQNQLPNEEPSIPLYVDGFYASTGAGAALSLNNIERVEVLRGPQGTLFGRNGTGGLINIVTRTPSEDAGGSVTIGYGNYNTLEGSLYLTGGLGAGVAADLSVFYSERMSGFGTNQFLGTDVGVNRVFAARTKWVANISERTRVTLTGEYSDIRSDYGMTTQLVPGILGFDGVTRRAGPQDINGNIDPITTPRTWAVTGRLDQELGFANLVSLTQYRDNQTYYQKDVDGIRENRGTAMQDEYTTLFTQEIQLVSNPGSSLQWVAGVFYLESEGGVDPLIIGGSQFGATINSQVRRGNVDTTSYAFFAQGTYEIAPGLNITLGGRYTHDEKTFSGRVVNNMANGTVVQVLLRTGDEPTSQLRSGEITYRVAVDYRIDPNVLLYGIISRGYKAGSFNILAIADPAVQPETLQAFEGGIKSDLFDRRLRLNLSAYHYDYSDIQLSQLSSATAGGSGGIRILNATSAEIYGAELEALLRLGPLTLGANLAYTHGRYGDFPGAPASFPLPYNCTTGLPTGPTAGRNAQCFRDATGNEVVRTTPFTSTLTASYEIPIGDDSLLISASWYHNDGFFWEVDNRVAEPAYDLVNADVRYTINDRWVVRFWARNLFDERYRIGISTSNNDQGAPGAPRTYGASLTVNF